MNAALAHDHLEPLDYELVEIRAREVKVGDTVVREGSIALPITGVRPEIYGFVVLEYTLCFGADARTYVADERVTVLRPKPEAGH